MCHISPACHWGGNPTHGTYRPVCPVDTRGRGIRSAGRSRRRPPTCGRAFAYRIACVNSVCLAARHYSHAPVGCDLEQLLSSCLRCIPSLHTLLIPQGLGSIKSPALNGGHRTSPSPLLPHTHFEFHLLRTPLPCPSSLIWPCCPLPCDSGRSSIAMPLSAASLCLLCPASACVRILLALISSTFKPFCIPLRPSR